MHHEHQNSGTSEHVQSLVKTGATAGEVAAGSLDVAQILTGKRILFIGGTGFLGKVTMSMLLCKYPTLGKLFALVRPGSGFTAETRFFQKIARSRPFDPVRQAFGDAAEGYLREKVTPLGGDVSRPNVGLSDADIKLLTADGPLDLIINCAGLVSFNPSLESALRINVYGVRYVLELSRKTGARVVHVSTCFVAGRREGDGARAHADVGATGDGTAHGGHGVDLGRHPTLVVVGIDASFLQQLDGHLKDLLAVEV